MKLPDANILIYAANTGSDRHRAARAWLEGVLSGSETVGFAWIVLLAFVRLTTKRNVFEVPYSLDEALDLVDSWLAQPCATVVQPGERHTQLMRELLGPVGTAGNLVNDAHLAALAIENGAELCSADNDFSRFPRLQWTDPLKP